LNRSNVVQIGGRAALAGGLFVWTLMYQAPITAVAADSEGSGRGWDARVEGTGSQGLQVRQGPSIDFPVQAIIHEGTIVHVEEGPRFDRDDRPWYRVSGYNRGGTSGWTAGDYLLGSPPAPANTLAASNGVSVAGAQTFMALITAYTYQVPGNGAHGSITKSGTVAHWGTVAVDPSVIPLGTRLMIEGFDDIFIAEDTGGGVRGDHVEIFFLDRGSALQFGVQRRFVTVLPR
jgi:3D (Asp-Asp-Asp) domain-containing protein